MSVTPQGRLTGICLLTLAICQPASAQRAMPFPTVPGAPPSTQWVVPMPTAPGQPAPATNVPTPQQQGMCNFPGAQYAPQCNGRQDSGGRQGTGERNENGVIYTSGPIGPIERTTLAPNIASMIALVPDTLVQAATSANLPPMWMRVCRTNTASSGQSLYVEADGETIRLSYAHCTNVAFRKKVIVGTTSNDQATIEYQMLGRH